MSDRSPFDWQRSEQLAELVGWSATMLGRAWSDQHAGREKYEWPWDVERKGPSSPYEVYQFRISGVRLSEGPDVLRNRRERLSAALRLLDEENWRMARLVLGLDRDEMAEAVGLSLGGWSKVEGGERMGGSDKTNRGLARLKARIRRLIQGLKANEECSSARLE